MTPDEARAEVYRTFKDEWADRTPLHRDGEPGFVEPGLDVSWARLSFRNLGGGQLTLGPVTGRKYRRLASAFVQVFTPVSKGVGVGDVLAHEARAILEGRRMNGVEFNDGVVTHPALGDGERVRQTNVEVSCTYDETK